MKMLSRNINFIYRKSLCKYLSAVPSNKRNESENFPLEVSSEIQDQMSQVLKHPDYFKVHNLFTIKDLFNARVHYGHKIELLNNKMRPFIFGSRLGHVIFDLDKTAFHLRQALNVAAHIAFREGVILFVSKNPQLTLTVEDTAMECKEYAVCRNWKLGTFTDSEKVFKSLTRLPDLCIILNTIEDNGAEHRVVIDSAKLCIPTIAIVDSNCDPNLITYPVPGNDDSFCSVVLYCKLFKEAILRGKHERAKLKSKKEDVKTQQLDISIESEKIENN